MKKNRIKKIIVAALVVILLAGTWLAWTRLPIITAYAAKGMCSSVFLAHKTQKRVEAEDLSFFPISLAKSTIDYNQKTVTTSVFGLAKRKAIYREGLGAVLVLQKQEETLKAAAFPIPAPGYSPDTVAWPKGDVLPAEKCTGVKYKQLNELLDTCFDAPGNKPFKKTLGIAVVYNNQLIAEKYLNGYDFNTMFHGWSMTKTITGALAGILADEGKLNLDEPAGFREWKNDARKDIKVKDIIQMSSGLDWIENYFTVSDATIMLMHKDDMLASVLDNKLAFPPGKHWRYSSGDANLLSGIIRNRINNDANYHNFIYTKLFYPTGMLHTKVETDGNGLFVASSYCYGATRDWARFGMLFLNNGVFAGDTILSKKWIDFMKTPAKASNGSYAGTFWLKESHPERALKDVPDDVFFADGFLGQRVYVIPSKKLVVVRMGYGLSNFNMNNFLRGIIQTLPE